MIQRARFITKVITICFLRNCIRQRPRRAKNWEAMFAPGLEARNGIVCRLRCASTNCVSQKSGLFLLALSWQRRTDGIFIASIARNRPRLTRNSVRPSGHDLITWQQITRQLLVLSRRLHGGKKFMSGRSFVFTRTNIKRWSAAVST